MACPPAGPCCLWPHGCSGRRRARPPARLGVLTAFGAAPRSPPVPSGPSGALHTCGAWCADRFGALSRSPARPCRRPRPPQPGPPVPPDWWSSCLFACGPTGVPGAVGPGRPRDRHTRACGSEWSISRPALALPPPTGTAARPSDPSGALHASGAWCADVVRHVCLKPSSPLLAGTCVGVKPSSPLRVRNGCFWRGFRLHW